VSWDKTANRLSGGADPRNAVGSAAVLPVE